jgi:hypothetical protein
MLHYFDCSLLLPIALKNPLLLYFIYFVYLRRKKKNFNKYIYVYKKGEMDYHASLHSLFIRPPGEAGRLGVMPRYKYRLLPCFTL